MGYLHWFPRKSIVAVIIQSFILTSAFAAGFQINEISPSLQGDATAGAAAANDDVSSTFVNPATLVTLTENQAYVGASLIVPEVTMKNATAIHTVNIPGFPPSSITADVVGSGYQRNATNTAFVPDLYASWRFTPKLVAGFSLTAPYGLVTNYHRNSVVRFFDRNDSVRTINFTPAIAYSFSQALSFGLGLQVQYITASFSNMNGPYTSIPEIDALIAPTHPTHLSGNSWGAGFTVGGLYRYDACTRFGVGFRSQIAERLKGHGQQYLQPGVTVPAPSQDFTFNAQTSVNAGIKTPAVLTVSAAQDIYDWTVKASVQYNYWHTFDRLSINMPDAFATNQTVLTKWRNTWFGALGTDYRWDCHWTFRGGIAYDETPTLNRYRDPRIPDTDRFWLSLGATYKYNNNFSFDAAYAHIFMRDQTVNVVQSGGISATSTEPLEVNEAHANYSGYVNIFALALRYSY